MYKYIIYSNKVFFNSNVKIIQCPEIHKGENHKIK